MTQGINYQEPSFVTFPHLERLDWLVHAFTTHRGGVSRGAFSSLNLVVTAGEEAEAVAENRRRVSTALGLPAVGWAVVRQVHGRKVVVVRRAEPELPFSERTNVSEKFNAGPPYGTVFKQAGKWVRGPACELPFELVYEIIGNDDGYGGREEELFPGVEVGSGGSATRQVKAYPGKAVVEADALLTAEPEIPLVTFHADCVPIFLAAVRRRVVGVVHAGWRGTAQAITVAAVRGLREVFGCEPDEILAGIGPAIGRCCYEVTDEVGKAVQAACGADETGLKIYWPNPQRPGHGQLDLWKANYVQLKAAGVPAENIVVSGLCTACRQDLFYSYRASGGVTGRMAALIMIRKKG